MRLVEVLEAYGHPKIRARHKTTLEVTREKQLTKRGDCIVAISASKGAADLSRKFLELMRNDNTLVTLTLKVANKTQTITGRGDSRLVLTHPTDLVVRKSSYVCTRTLMVQADRAASDLSADFVEVLRDPSAKVMIEIAAEL